MAITLVNTDGEFLGAPTGNKTSETSTTLQWSSSAGYNASADDVIVIAIAGDNAGTSGASSFSSIGQPSTGAVTWETAQVVNRTAASAANDGCTLIVLVGKVTSAISASSTIAVSWSPATVAKGWYGYLIRGASPTIQTFASSTGTGTAPTVTSGSSPVRAIQNGDFVFAAAASESNTPPTGDSDTTNGSWSTMRTAVSGGAGGDATKMSVGVQNKIVNANGNQQFDPGTTNSDFAVAVMGLGVPAAAAKSLIVSRRAMRSRIIR